MTANTLLLKALNDSGLTRDQLAQKIEVDPKTVERWITTGRSPYPAHQYAVAEAVGVDKAQLWPPCEKNDVRQRSEARNERLREALFKARITPEQLAERLEINPKTVERWISRGVVPYPRFKSAAAIAVEVPEHELWPDSGSALDRCAEQLIREQAATPSATAPDHEVEPTSPAERLRSHMSWIERDRETAREPERAPQMRWEGFSR